MARVNCPRNATDMWCDLFRLGVKGAPSGLAPLMSTQDPKLTPQSTYQSVLYNILLVHLTHQTLALGGQG